MSGKNMQTIELREMESVYNIEADKKFADKFQITPDEMLDFAAEIKNKYNIKERHNKSDISTDMLLFEYGTFYDCYDGKGLRFNLSITRQVSIENSAPHENDYALYQLCMMLCYDPTKFDNSIAANEWSKDYNTLDEFIAVMKETEGFLLAKTLAPIDFEIHFTEC
jgi:hypothetical protein